jgi:hypothetical protein
MSEDKKNLTAAPTQGPFRLDEIIRVKRGEIPCPEVNVEMGLTETAGLLYLAIHGLHHFQQTIGTISEDRFQAVELFAQALEGSVEDLEKELEALRHRGKR